MMYKQSQKIDNYFEKVGSFNSGIIGYFTKKTVVVNLDGLVNDNIPDFLKSNRMEEYCLKNKINFISEFKLKPSKFQGISNTFFDKLRVIDSLIPNVKDNYLFDINEMNKHYIYLINE